MVNIYTHALFRSSRNSKVVRLVIPARVTICNSQVRRKSW